MHVCATWLCQKNQSTSLEDKKKWNISDLYDEQTRRSRSLASSHLSLDGRSIIDNLGRQGYYNGHRQFFARAASLREYADAFLGGGFNYTSHAHPRPFGPAAHLGRRRGRSQKKQVESSARY